jgi:CRP-like cAMP-binding protein
LDTHTKIKTALGKFGRFSDEQVNLFSSMVVIKQVEKSSLVLKRGQVCSFIAIVLKGSLRLYNPENEQTLYFFTEHDCAADHDSFVAQKPAVNCIEATEKSEIAVLSIQNAHKLIEMNQVFLSMGRFLGKLSGSPQLSVYNTSPIERYTELMEKHPEWIIRFPQKQLASYLGMTPETFSRMKRKSLFS